MKLLGLGDIVRSVSNLADDLITSEEERLKIALAESKLESALVQEQIRANAVEAQHGSVFVAGWRPFIGWVGGLAFAYQFLFYPFMGWGWALAQAKGWIPCHGEVEMVGVGCIFAVPPPLDIGPLFAVVTGMLGIGGLRSFDKLKKTDTKMIR